MIEEAYKLAKKKYKEDFGVDTDKVLDQLEKISISLHCWQGDDVGGFEKPGAELRGGGIVATGNFPGKARNVKELRQDYEKVLSLLPGNYRVNLHAIYGEFEGKDVERDNFLSSEEALEYGLIDKVITSNSMISQEQTASFEKMYVADLKEML